jgi:hypothetical protein
MTLELERLTCEQVLARMVEMELQKVVSRPADHAGAAGIGIHLNGVTIVEDAQRKRTVVDLDLAAHVRRDRAGEIDRRLFETELADLEVGGELAPMLRTGRSPVAPMRRRSRTG